MRGQIGLSLAAGLLCVVFAGCQGPGEAELSHIDPVCFAGAGGTEAVMQRAEEVLRDMQFVIEKYDVQSGYIATKPLRGSQFAEVWRRDNVGAGSIAEANIQSVQRTAQISFSQDGGRVCVKCEVNTRRLSMEEGERMITMSQMAGSFSGGGAGVLTLRPDSEGMAWIELGAEPGLEKLIVTEIEEGLARGE